MNSIRSLVDLSYDFAKPLIFRLTEKDPEIAHEIFVEFLRALHFSGLESAVLEFEGRENGIKISNAAGFNKNGKIPPTILKYLGFDRAVVGTVTGEGYSGNPRPRIRRFPETNSLVNWMKFPGDGAEDVARTMDSYGEHEVPITMNIGPTPGKKGKEIFIDLRESVRATRDLHGVDRYEVNISCPNTEEEISKYISQLAGILESVYDEKKRRQEVYVKVSPDLIPRDVYNTVLISNQFPVSGFTTTNTTTEHRTKYIPESLGKGGASGDAVYERSFAVQKMFCESLGENSVKRIIACGGIDSRERMKERIAGGADEIQIFTPLIFRGPKLLRELKNHPSRQKI